MTAVILPMSQSRHEAVSDARLDWLAESLLANRFLPEPPPEKLFVGDGDFRAIGGGFLCHFVRLGGLKPSDRVLDIGCGIGRMAVPLTQYLDPATATYEGIDVVADGIEWCSRTITPVYPNFTFRHLDAANSLYNPDGTVAIGELTLPYEDGSFDFVFMTSVITHLEEADVAAYAREIGRLLDPGGRCFVSLFLMNDEARRHLSSEPGRLPFDTEAEGPVYFAHPEVPLAAVAYEEGHLIDLFSKAGLRLRAAPAYGHWCGRQPANNYQDICVFERMEAV